MISSKNERVINVTIVNKKGPNIRRIVQSSFELSGFAVHFVHLRLKMQTLPKLDCFSKN